MRRAESHRRNPLGFLENREELSPRLDAIINSPIIVTNRPATAEPSPPPDPPARRACDRTFGAPSPLTMFSSRSALRDGPLFRLVV